MGKKTDAEKRAKKRSKRTESKMAEMTSAIESVANLGNAQDKATVELVERVAETLDGAALSANIGDLITNQITEGLVDRGMSVQDPVITRMYRDAERFKDLSLRLATVPVVIAEKRAK